MNIKERHQYAKEKYGLLRSDLHVLRELNRKGDILRVLRKNPGNEKIVKILGDYSKICTKETFYRIEHLIKAMSKISLNDSLLTYHEDCYRISDKGIEVLKDVYRVQLDLWKGKK